MSLFIYLFLFCFCFLGHTWQRSGVTTGSELRNCSWQAQAHMGYQDQTQVHPGSAMCEANALPAVLSLFCLVYSIVPRGWEASSIWEGNLWARAAVMGATGLPCAGSE